MGKARIFPICFLFVWLFPCSLSMKQRSNVISYVTVNDSPDSDSSLNSPYAIDTLASLESTGGALELPTREAADSSSSRNIIVPPLKTQLSDCVVATQVSGRYGFCHSSDALLSRTPLSLKFWTICIGFSAALGLRAAVLRVQALICFQFH